MKRKKTVMRFFITYIILLTLLGFSSTAAAQQCPESATPSADRTRARELYEQGVEYYNMNRYGTALEKFNCSYRLYPHRDTLFNMGRCNEEVGNYQAASENYRLYIERYPEAPDISDIEARVLNIEQRFEQAASEEGSGPVPPGVNEQGGEVSGYEAVQAEEADQPVLEVNEQPQAVAPLMTQMSTARKYAWTTLALGLVLSGSGAGFLGSSLSLLGDINKRKESQFCTAELEEMSDRGGMYLPTGIALMGVGVATLITSIVLFTVFDGEQRIAQARSRGLNLGAMVSGQGGGLMLNGRF